MDPMLNYRNVSTANRGQIGFADLARAISTRWKKLSDTDKIVFEDFVVAEKVRYKTQMSTYNKKIKKLQQDEQKANKIERANKANTNKQSLSNHLTTERANLDDSIPKPSDHTDLSHQLEDAASEEYQYEIQTILDEEDDEDFSSPDVGIADESNSDSSKAISVHIMESGMMGMCPKLMMMNMNMMNMMINGGFPGMCTPAMMGLPSSMMNDGPYADRQMLEQSNFMTNIKMMNGALQGMYNPEMLGKYSMMNNVPYFDQGLEEETYDDSSEDDDTSFYGEAMNMADEAVSFVQASMPGYDDSFQTMLANHTMRMKEQNQKMIMLMMNNNNMIRNTEIIPSNGTIYENSNQMNGLHQNPNID
jgi:hypothetical protein